MDDEQIKSEAISFAKKNKIRLAKEITNPVKYAPDIYPVSVFMAGSPGAGKTEYSRNLIKILEENMQENQKCRVVRIDSDDIRPLIPGYTGNNSKLFQGAVSLVVEKVHDLVLHNKQNFILDGTFSKYEKAKSNIQRSLDEKREVIVFYVYQKPETAWRLTQAREIVEGRNIPKEAFIDEFLGARETIKKIAADFKNNITLFFAEKDFEKSTENVLQIETSSGDIDSWLGKQYTKEELEKLI